MTAPAPEPSAQLLAARRELEGHPGVRLTGEMRWSAKHSSWAFPVELTLDGAVGNDIPAVSSWYVVVDARYPWGLIEIYPAKVGGITLTYWHQDHNGPGQSEVPWREGDLCVRMPEFVLGRQGKDHDPIGRPERLRWYIERARLWLARAAAGTLVRDGEPFELPQFRSDPRIIAFVENEETFAAWSASAHRHGTAELVPLAGDFPAAVRRFLTPDGAELVKPRWGKAIGESSQVQRSAWIRLPTIPLIGPYAAPMTAGELFRALESQGLKPDQVLAPALSTIRDGSPRILLVGFPIPRQWGDAPALMYWQPLLLTGLSHGREAGNRKLDSACWQRDKAVALADKKRLMWLTARNWDAAVLATRGRLPEAVCSRRTLLLGAGALGSAIGEHLARGGVRRIVVIDGDRLEAGNLGRHALSLQDVGGNKATQLAIRLNLLSPQANVDGIVAPFPLLDEPGWAAVDECDLVIDCTGSDEAMHALSTHEWPTSTLFVSASMGRDAKRLYAFTATGSQFPAAKFWEEVEPHLERERAGAGDTEFPYEGPGCWHPVYPARGTSVERFACDAVSLLERAIAEPDVNPRLHVIDLIDSDAPTAIESGSSDG